MKSTYCVMIFGLLMLIAGSARAQDANIPSNAYIASDDLRPTPTMVVHEVAPASSSIKPAGADKPATAEQKKTTMQSKLVASAAVMEAPRPMVLPAATVSSPVGMGSTGNSKYDEFVAQSAARNGVDPNLILAVMHQESGFNQRARSYKGATGLMQLMPATAWRFGVTNINDPAQNIEGGAKYLRFLLDSFNGDVNLALAGYNAGENAVVNSGYRVPRYRETQNYVRSITARYDNTKSKAKPVASSGTVAPSAAVFAGGASSSRLSNNY
jgi:soluble lytic murein transglycosylase-like protein